MNVNIESHYNAKQTHVYKCVCVCVYMCGFFNNLSLYKTSSANKKKDKILAFFFSLTVWMPQSPLVKTLNCTAHNIMLNARACYSTLRYNYQATLSKQQAVDSNIHLRMLIVTCHQAYFTGQSWSLSYCHSEKLWAIDGTRKAGLCRHNKWLCCLFRMDWFLKTKKNVK